MIRARAALDWSRDRKDKSRYYRGLVAGVFWTRLCRFDSRVIRKFGRISESGGLHGLLRQWVVRTLGVGGDCRYGGMFSQRVVAHRSLVRLKCRTHDLKATINWCQGRRCNIESPVNRNQNKPLTKFLLVKPLQVGHKAVRVFMPRNAVDAIDKVLRRGRVRTLTRTTTTNTLIACVITTRVLIFSSLAAHGITAE